MRLINADALVNSKTPQLEEFLGKKVPPYAILSHTWGDDEVSLQDFKLATNTTSAGYAKIEYTCAQALEYNLKYAWVDTCCIDKTNSAELSEAINSMFQWYENAIVCFAYLVDVPPKLSADAYTDAFGKCRWFTRGWTLQELLAPEHLIFLASDWSIISDRNSLASVVSLVTGIRKAILEEPLLTRLDRMTNLETAGDSSYESISEESDISLTSRKTQLDRASIAEKMSWAAARVTTREEDIAYCLLGIFDINIPLLYGEGMNAFNRLQKEIIQRRFDPTILAWNSVRDGTMLRLEKDPPYSAWRSALDMLLGTDHPWCHNRFAQHYQEDLTESAMGLLATSPASFLNCQQLIACADPYDLSLTARGLLVNLPLSEDRIQGPEPFSITNVPSLLLPCRPRDDPWSLVSLPLVQLKSGVYSRINLPARLVSHYKWSMWPRRSVNLLVRKLSSIGLPPESGQKLWIRNISADLRLIDVHVSNTGRWLADRRIIQMPPRLSNLRHYETLNSVFALIVVEGLRPNKRFGIILDVWQPPSYYLPAIFPGIWWVNHHMTVLEYESTSEDISSVFQKARECGVHHMPKYLACSHGILHVHVSYERVLGELTPALYVDLTPHGFRSILLEAKFSLASFLRRSADCASAFVCPFLHAALNHVLPYDIRHRHGNITADLTLQFLEILLIAEMFILWYRYSVYGVLYLIEHILLPKLTSDNYMSSPEDVVAKALILVDLSLGLYDLLPIVAYLLPTTSDALKSRHGVLSLLISLTAVLALPKDWSLAIGMFLVAQCHMRNWVDFSNAVKINFLRILICGVLRFLLTFI